MLKKNHIILIEKIPPAKYLSSIIFTLYLGISLIRYLWPGNLIITSSLVLLGLLALVLSSLKIHNKNILIYIFIGSLAAAFLFSSLFVHRTDRIGHVLLFILMSSGIALLLLGGNVRSKSVYQIFIALSFYFVYFIYIDVDPNDALIVVSRNGISEMMIVSCVCLYIVKNKDGGKIDLWPAFITLIVAVWAIGRSGIISSFILFVGLLLIKMRTRALYFYMICLTLLTSILYFKQFILMTYDTPFFRPAVEYYLARTVEVGPDVRIALWANYLNNLDIFRVFFGANVHTDPWPDGGRYAYNYHNMFIHLHLQTGLMAVAIYMLILSALIKFWMTNKVFFVLLLTICIRGITDTFLFFESWDFVLYYFIFYYLGSLLLWSNSTKWRSTPRVELGGKCNSEQ